MTEPRTLALVFYLLAPGATVEAPFFAEHAADWGLGFVHEPGAAGQLFFPEIMGAGAAWFDYDGDGDLDAYLAQGGWLGGGPVLTDRLFRNDLTRQADGTWQPRFVDVTATAGIEEPGYGMGLATGDVDGDGWVDLYVANFGPNRLWHNRGDGTFEDWTTRAGVDDPRWSVAATFFDADGDGHQDLYLANYVDFRLDHNVECLGPSSVRDYCGPTAYRPETDRLWRNRGDGTFEDWSARAGLLAAPGAGLGVVAGDFDGDGDEDVYVTNDQMPNQLWLNQQSGRFEDGALLGGCALDGRGRSQASMGVDAGDYDGDGDEDLFLTHLNGETNTLYANDGGGLFRDVTAAAGLAAPSLPFTSFGTSFVDLDHDGLLDLVVVSGEVRRVEALAQQGDPFPFAQARQVFLQASPGRFVDASARAGAAFQQPEVGRGAAFGDVDLDGDVDVLVTNTRGPARLFVNQLGSATGWLTVEVRVPRGGPALGAWVEALPVPAPGAARGRRVRTGASYGSANAPEVHFGRGNSGGPERLRVTGPGRPGWELRGSLPPGRWVLSLSAPAPPPASP